MVWNFFSFCTQLWLLNLVFCMVKEFLGVGWIRTRKVDFDLKWFSIFYRCLTFVC